MRNFALETYFSKWEFSARHHMTASDAQAITVGELLDLAGYPRDVLNDLHLGYTETWGAPDLREAIACTFEQMQPENVLCFAGAEEGGLRLHAGTALSGRPCHCRCAQLSSRRNFAFGYL